MPRLGLLVATNKPSLGIIQAEISSIKPSRFQARKNIPPESIKELSDSIKTQGVIQPLIVRKLAKGYELVYQFITLSKLSDY